MVCRTYSTVWFYLFLCTTGDLLRETCSKKSSKICNCLFLLIAAVCIVAVVAGVTTVSLLLQDNSATLYMNTTFNSTVVFPLKEFVRSFTITSYRVGEYSCVLATVTLPCSSLSKSYLKNQSVNDISNDLERLYFYLLNGSVMHFVFNSDSLCPSYTLWVFSDKLNDQIAPPVPCNPLSEHKFNGKCKSFTGSGVFDYQVPKDAYYFYTGYDCRSERPKLSLTIDYYWYDFSQYVNRSDVQTVYVPPLQHRVITAANLFSFSRTCTLIHTPNTSDCRAGNSFESPVSVSGITLYPVARLIFIMPVVFVSLVVVVVSFIGYAVYFIRKYKKVEESCVRPVQQQN